MKYKFAFPFLLLIFLFPIITNAQSDSLNIFDYSNPTQFEIGGIKVSGAEFSDENSLIAITGLKVGDEIRVPGTEIPQAIKALWKLRLFTDVQIYNRFIKKNQSVISFLLKSLYKKDLDIFATLSKALKSLVTMI